MNKLQAKDFRFAKVKTLKIILHCMYNVHNIYRYKWKLFSILLIMYNIIREFSKLF